MSVQETKVDSPQQGVYNGPPDNYERMRKAFAHWQIPQLQKMAKNEDWYKESQAAIDALCNSPIVAVDIEAAGARYDFLLVSLGFAIITPGHCDKIHKFKINLPIPCMPEKFEPNMKLMWWEQRCIKEFWSTLSPELLNQLRHPNTSKDANDHDSYTSYVAYIKAVQQAVKELRDRIESLPSEPILISDNPEFDLGWLNYLIINYDIYAGKDDGDDEEAEKPNPLRYSKKFGYLTVTDVNDFLGMFDKKKVKELLEELDFKKQFVHSHDPADDAARMLHKFDVALHLKRALLPLNDVVMDQARASKRKLAEEAEEAEAAKKNEKLLKEMGEETTKNIEMQVD